MQSTLVRKIVKAKRYAQQPDRVRLTHLVARFQGDNGEHELVFQHNGWSCNCPSFGRDRTCSHTMAMEYMLEGMIPTAEGANGVGKAV